MNMADLPPGYREQNSGNQLIAVAVAFIVLDAVFVGLRFIARWISRTTLGWDDFLIVPTLFLNLGVSSLAIELVRSAGVGRHLDVVLAENPYTIVVWAKMILALQPLYFFSIFLPKISVLCFYLRIFVIKSHRIFTYVIIVLICLNLVATLIAAFLQCMPLAYAWDKSIQGGYCFDQVAFYRWISLPNIATDCAILALPGPLLYHLQISRNRKLGLCFVFATGSFGLISSCFPLHSAWLRTSVTLVSWTIIEGGTYTIAACLPTLRPLFKYFGFASISTKSSDPTEDSAHTLSGKSGRSLSGLGFSKLGGARGTADVSVYSTQGIEYDRREEIGLHPISKQHSAPLGGIKVKSDIEIHHVQP